MTISENVALASSAGAGREIPRDDQLLDLRGAAMKRYRERNHPFDEPAGEAVSDFHLATSISLRGQSANEMHPSQIGSRSTSGDA